MTPESSLLPIDWTVPSSLRNRLGASAGRQRLLEEDGHLLLVLHAPPTADETGRRGRFFWRDTAGNWRVAAKAERIGNLDQHLADYRRDIEHLEQDEDLARDARDYFNLLDRLAPLNRAIRNMYETLQAAREAASDDRQLILARDQAYELTRRADLLYADAKNGLDFAMAWQAEQQAESSHQMSVATHRLNLLVAFFFPIATLMTIFGANLQHGFERWDRVIGPIPLIVTLAAGLVGGFALTRFVTRLAPRPQREAQSNSSSSSTKRSK
jgi:hypothetical protein